MSALVAEQITAGYGRVPIVQGVCLSGESGKVVSLVGPNGAGKSTFLKSIFGLLRQTTGRVVVDGQDVSGWRPHRIARSGMAYVPQVENVFVSMSVVENLEMGGFVRRQGMQQRITDVLDIFPDLAAARHKKAGELSGGQRNMLGMARALMLDPKVLLLDEPTAGLAPMYVKVVWEQVRRIAGTGTAVVVVEQNVDLALDHSDWVQVLVAGQTRLEGPPAVVKAEDLPSLFLGGGRSRGSGAEPAAIASQAAHGGDRSA